MKIIKIIAISLLISCGSIPKPEEKSDYNSVFQEYKKEFKTLYVYLNDGSGSYKILGKKNVRWELIDIYDLPIFPGKDSIVRRPCNNCDSIDKVIRNYDVLNLKSEEQLGEQCIEALDTTGGVISIRRFLDPNTHIPIHALGFKIKGRENHIKYLDPYKAIEICPQSKERQIMIKIIDAIRWAK